MADNLKELTASIVASYVETNKIAAADLPSIIKSTYAALSGVGQQTGDEPEAVTKPTAAQIRKSITPDKLISFIDNRPYTLLKRHLTTHGLTPAAYRDRFGLPANYPIVAANYAARRSELARSMGLGRKFAAEPEAAPAAAAPRMIVGAASKSPKGEKAGPGARVPKALRSANAKNKAEDEST
jgi:predicted transcriptional regulator